MNTLFENAGQGGTIAAEDWPAVCQNRIDLHSFGLSAADGPVLVSTYATQLLSWYLGSTTADTYFCPERHGTYFGSFYLKDIPPFTSSEPVTIDSNITANMGTLFLNALDTSQKSLITDLVELQKTNLSNIVTVR